MLWVAYPNYAECCPDYYYAKFFLSVMCSQKLTGFSKVVLLGLIGCVRFWSFYVIFWCGYVRFFRLGYQKQINNTSVALLSWTEYNLPYITKSNLT